MRSEEEFRTSLLRLRYRSGSNLPSQMLSILTVVLHPKARTSEGLKMPFTDLRIDGQDAQGSGPDEICPLERN